MKILSFGRIEAFFSKNNQCQKLTVLSLVVQTSRSCRNTYYARGIPLKSISTNEVYDFTKTANVSSVDTSFCTKTTNMKLFDFDLCTSMMFLRCPLNKVSLSGFTMGLMIISKEDDLIVTIIDSDNSSGADEPSYVSLHYLVNTCFYPVAFTFCCSIEFILSSDLSILC